MEAPARSGEVGDGVRRREVGQRAHDTSGGRTLQGVARPPAATPRVTVGAAVGQKQGGALGDQSHVAGRVDIASPPFGDPLSGRRGQVARGQDRENLRIASPFGRRAPYRLQRRCARRGC